MKRKYLLLLLCATLALILFRPINLSTENKIKKSFFSAGAANLKNLIHINKLSQSDYESISIENHGKIFVSKNGISKQIYFNGKQVRSLILSPSKKQVAFSYYVDEPEDQIFSLMLLDLDTKNMKEIFRTNFSDWDITTGPQWLGNKNLFFLRHCGTACQGITLLNIKTGRTKNAVLSYPSFPQQSEITHFKDWFGKEYWLDGFVDKVIAETSNSNYYLVFSLQDRKRRNLGEQRILFLGSEEK